MKAYIISDKEFRTEVFEQLSESVTGYLKNKGFELDECQVGRKDLAFCKGCFGCWVKKPGECIIGDNIAVINENFINSDVVVYLSPVVFGQFSANIKNVMDRWLPNILPYFEVRPDGSTIHPGRYDNYPKQLYIAYGDQLELEDAQLFTDIIKKHRRNVDIIIYKNAPDDLTKELEAVELKKVGAKI